LSGAARLAVAGIVLLNVAGGQGKTKATKAGTDRSGTVFCQGLTRTYLLHLPSGFDKAKPAPLVFVLHGGGGDGARAARLTRFRARADSDGFVVCYPNAVNHHWNDGRQVRRFRSQREGIDDVGFISELIDRFVADLGIDPTRVYATGISNGGMMCYRLGCELAGRIAAIAPVAAAMPALLADSARPTRPIPVLAINGTADPLVPYQGGGVGLDKKRGVVLSVPRTIELWAKLNRCSPKPDTSVIPSPDLHNGLRVVCRRYSGGRDAGEVILYRVEGGGHTWPAGAPRAARFGKATQALDATRVIWEFFKRHRQEAVGE